MTSTMCVDRLVLPEQHHHHPHHFHYSAAAQHQHQHQHQQQHHHCFRQSSPVTTFGKPESSSGGNNSSSSSSSSSPSSSSSSSSTPSRRCCAATGSNSNRSSGSKSSSNNLNCKICSSGEGSVVVVAHQQQQQHQQHQHHHSSKMPETPPIKVLKSKLVELQSINKASLINNNTAAGIINECPEYIVDKRTKTTYLKGKFLGKGGFAKCYELTDLTTNKVFAGKIIPKNRLSKPYQKDKIMREVSLHKQLSHPNVVGCHDYFEDSNNVYITLEYCAKKSLVHLLKTRKRLTEIETRYFIHQLVMGTEFIHSQRIIHRDLKLGNMLLDDNMTIKIADFGLATSVGEGEKKMSVCGTPNYIAPEVLTRAGHSYEVDVWAVGCVMFALLVGQPPFETSTLKDTYTRITKNKFNIPHYVSSQAANLIKMLLTPDPALRPSLQDILNHEFFTSGPMPTSLPPSCTLAEPVFTTPPPTPLHSTPPTPLHSTPPTPLHSTPPTPPRSTESVDDVAKVTTVLSDVRLSEGRCHQPTVKFISPLTKPTPATSKLVKKPSMRSVLKKAVPNYLKTNLGTNNANNNNNNLKTISDVYSSLCYCLDNAAMMSSSTNKTSMPQPVDQSVTWITKWVDYSNKYGFGFHLSNGSAGVVFNDGSKLLTSPGNRHFQYVDSHGKRIKFESDSGPESVRQKVLLLHYFIKYMEENLMEGGGGSSATSQPPTATSQPPTATPQPVDIPYVRSWYREWDSELIVMLLSSSSLQINFIRDHSKLVLCGEGGEVKVMLCDEKRQCTTYTLTSLLSHNLPEDLLAKLYIARNKLKRVMEMGATQV